MTTVVTGGATGIGFATARRLGQDGQAVVLASRKRERLEKARDRLRREGVACEIAELDVRDAASVDTLSPRTRGRVPPASRTQPRRRPA